MGPAALTPVEPLGANLDTMSPTDWLRGVRSGRIRADDTYPLRLRYTGAIATIGDLVAWATQEAENGVPPQQAIRNVLFSHIPTFVGNERALREAQEQLKRALSDDTLRGRLEQSAIQVQRAQSEEAKRVKREELAKFNQHTYKGDVRMDHGYFHAEYDPARQTLTISVPIQFNFVDSVAKWLDPDRRTTPATMIEKQEVRSWRPSEKEEWQAKFIKIVQDTWSNQHTIYSHEVWWEDVKVRVIVKVDEIVNPGAGEAFFNAKIYRGNAPKEACGPGTSELTECVGDGFAIFHYDASEDEVHVLAHEFGHMLGLDDEYDDSSKPNKTEASHSNLVFQEFGEKVPRRDPIDRTDRFRGSIMSIYKGKVLPEHGVVFLQAMREITGRGTWHLRPQTP